MGWCTIRALVEADWNIIFEDNKGSRHLGNGESEIIFIILYDAIAKRRNGYVGQEARFYPD